MIIPVSCPSCGLTLKQIGVHLVCTNHHECNEQVIQKILFWVQSCEMDGFSESTIRTLYKNGILRSIKGLYSLKASDMENLDGFGTSRIDNIINQIQATREMTTQDFIARLGIPSVGKKALQNLNIKTVDDFKVFKDSKYAVGRAIIEWKSIPENMELVEDLLPNINFMLARQNATKVCATGTAPMGRKELIKYLEDNGCEWVDSVGKDTVLLLTDDLAGSSSKMVKARKLGIQIKTYSEFLNGK